MEGLIEIQNDLFDIASRLKSINENYRVYYNKSADRYEVHNISQRPNTLAFVVPYGELDARTVDYARYTAVQNAQKVLKEMEESNKKVQKETCTRKINELMSKMEEL